MAWISSKIRQPARAEERYLLTFNSIFHGGKKIVPPLLLQRLLTYPLSNAIGVVTPLVVGGQHLLQHQQDTRDQAFVLSAAKLTLKL